MDALTLRKTTAEIMPSVLWVIVAVIWIVVTFKQLWLLHMFWWLILALYIVRLSIDLWQPLLDHQNGQLRIKPYKSPIHTECLTVTDIREVRETTRKVGGMFRLIDLPSFPFVLNDGREIEHFPALSSEKRLHTIRTFIDQIPGIPPLQKVTLSEPSEH